MFSDTDIKKELEWFEFFKKKGTPVLSVISKADIMSDDEITQIKSEILKVTKEDPLVISAENESITEKFKETLIRLIPQHNRRFSR